MLYPLSYEGLPGQSRTDGPGLTCRYLLAGRGGSPGLRGGLRGSLGPQSQQKVSRHLEHGSNTVVVSAGRVGVAVERGRRLLVPKQPLDLVDRHAVRHEPRRVAVPEVVEPLVRD